MTNASSAVQSKVKRATFELSRSHVSKPVASIAVGLSGPWLKAQNFAHLPCMPDQNICELLLLRIFEPSFWHGDA